VSVHKGPVVMSGRRHLGSSVSAFAVKILRHSRPIGRDRRADTAVRCRPVSARVCRGTANVVGRSCQLATAQFALIRHRVSPIPAVAAASFWLASLGRGQTVKDALLPYPHLVALTSHARPVTSWKCRLSEASST